MSLSKFAKPLVLSVIALALVCAATTRAQADSVTYDVSASFSNGMVLSGHYSWDTELFAGSGGATEYLLDLTSTAGAVGCSDSSGELCTYSYALFAGSGGLEGSLGVILSLLDSRHPEFTLGIQDGAGSLLFLETVTTTSSVHVPEPSSMIDLVVVFCILAWVFPRAKAAVAVR